MPTKVKPGKQTKSVKNSKKHFQKSSISAEPIKTESIPRATANSCQGAVRSMGAAQSSSGKGVVDPQLKQTINPRSREGDKKTLPADDKEMESVLPRCTRESVTTIRDVSSVASAKMSSLSLSDPESTPPADVELLLSDRDPMVGQYSRLYPDLAMHSGQSSLQSDQCDEKSTSLQCGKEQKMLSQQKTQLTEQANHVREGDMPATYKDVLLSGTDRFDLAEPNTTMLQSTRSSSLELHEAKKKVEYRDQKPILQQPKNCSLQKMQGTEQSRSTLSHSKRGSQYPPPYNRTGSYEERGATRLSLQYEHDTRQRSQSFHSRRQPGLLHHRYTMRIPVRLPYCSPDLEEYQKEYPTMKDDPTKSANYEFYAGKIAFRPKGSYIDKIHENWWGRYDILEHRHDFIQWLFPTRDGSGVSFYAQPLQKHEMTAICADENAHERVLKSFKMMLDFYGMELTETGKVMKSKVNWRERFAHLDWSPHNHMRITRILKSLGELNYEFLKPQFVVFVLECIQRRELMNVANSCMRYWVETIRDRDERDSLWCMAESIKY